MNYRIYRGLTHIQYETTVTSEQIKSVLFNYDSNDYVLIIEHDISLDQDSVYYQGYVNEYDHKIKRKRI